MTESVPDRSNNPTRKIGLRPSEAVLYTKLARREMRLYKNNPQDMKQLYGDEFTCPTCSKKSFTLLEGGSTCSCCDSCWSKHTPRQQVHGCGKDFD